MANLLTFDSGVAPQVRISEDSGAVALAGPDRAGTPLATVVTFEPPASRSAARSVRSAA